MGKVCDAGFRMNALAGPLELRENHGFGAPDLAMIGAELARQKQRLAAAWKAMHGKY